MSYIQKRGGKYRARFKDPLGNTLSRTFARKADAQRFLLDLEADRVRGRWVDPRDADMPVAVWAEEWLSLCRRLAERTQDTYRRDLCRFVLPRFGSYRLGHLPADEIENWLMDELDSGNVQSPSMVGWRVFLVPWHRLIMSLWDSHELAPPPPEGWRRDLWLLHVAGFIVMNDIRRLTREEMAEDLSADERRAAEQAIYATIANVLTVADGVIGGMHDDEFDVSLRLAIRLDDRATGRTVQDLDLFDSDGACGCLDIWINGDFGEDPVAHDRPT